MAVRLAAAVVAAAAVTLLTSRRLKCMLRRRLARVRLTYFDINGLGEPIRLALVLADMSFTDERLTREQFADVKPQLRFGQVPCLTVNGDEYFQSSAILRYIGRAFDSSGSLYPSGNLAVAATIDALLDACTDMVIGKKVFTYRERFGFPEAVFTPPVLESIQAKWTHETLPRHLGFFVHCLAQSPTGWVAGTHGPSVADVLLASVLRNDITPIAPLPPPLADLVERVYSLPAVAAFKLAEAKRAEAKG